jgi:hypothetical protein
MSRTAVVIAILFTASSVELGAHAQEANGSGMPDGYVAAQNGPAEPAPAGYAPPAGPEQEGPPPPIPPFVDAPPVAAAGGGFCFEGPHPVDSSVEPGVTWDATTGRHVHGYPPFDLRLFSFQNGCYYFIGDPTDFGYAGNTFSYYGAHPILATYGGGWCFMIGPHRHVWRPWSPLFVTVGPWFYWEGPFDPFFWTYWPYYHFYYRSHYPHYYARGAFFRGHTVAPRIATVPRPQRYGNAWHGAGGAYRAGPMAPHGAAPTPGGANRAAPVAPHGAVPAPGARTAQRPWHLEPAPHPVAGSPRITFSAPATPRSGGGAHFGGGGRFRR